MDREPVPMEGGYAIGEGHAERQVCYVLHEGNIEVMRGERNQEGRPIGFWRSPGLPQNLSVSNYPKSSVHQSEGGATLSQCHSGFH